MLLTVSQGIGVVAEESGVGVSSWLRGRKQSMCEWLAMHFHRPRLGGSKVGFQVPAILIPHT